MSGTGIDAAANAVAVAPPAPSEPPPAGGWLSRWSDRLNPILVREVQQAVKGRAFVFTVLLALAVSVVIATAVAGSYEGNDRSGRDAFAWGLAVLAPLLLFVVPMQAYQSMRLELRAGIVEQLLLSRLRPRRIVAGKLAAAMVQFVLYLSVLSPLLATSYLLRGVDLPTIAVSLVFGLAFCVGATAFAIMSATQGMLPALQGLNNVGVALALGGLSFGMVGYTASGEFTRDVSWVVRSTEFAMVMSLVLGGITCGVVLSGLVAQSFLMHAFENRSTGFRVFLFAMVAVSFGWMAAFVPTSQWDEAVPTVAFFLVLLGTVFGVFMVTEQRTLSPRTRSVVPADAVRSLLLAPLLPGRDRGFLCLLVYLAVVAAVAGAMWSASAGPAVRFAEEILRAGAFVLAYTLIYLSLGKALRAVLPTTMLGTHAARIAIPLLLFVCCLAPFLFDVLLRGGPRNWHPGHALNPFWTIERFGFRDRGDEVLIGLGVAAAALVAMHLPSLAAGVREVLGAAADRRARAAGRAVPEPRDGA
jgi:hypothetical protein